MAQSSLTASDLQLFGLDATARDAIAAGAESAGSASKIFLRWLVGTFALAMTGLTFALLVVRSASTV